MQIVERVKYAASQRGYTIAALEQKLGFGNHTIYKWNKNSPSVEKVLAVANFLDISLTWLVTGEYESPDKSHPSVQKYMALSETDKEKIGHFIEVCLCQPEDKDDTDSSSGKPSARPIIPPHSDSTAGPIATPHSDPIAGLIATPHSDPIAGPIAIQHPDPVRNSSITPGTARKNHLPTGHIHKNHIPILGYTSSDATRESFKVYGYKDTKLPADFILITGDLSMYPLFRHDHLVYVKQESMLSNGDFGIFLRNHQLVCRQYLSNADHITLRAFNPDFPEETYKKNDLQAVKIIGKVMHTPSDATDPVFFLNQ